MSHARQMRFGDMISSVAANAHRVSLVWGDVGSTCEHDSLPLIGDYLTVYEADDPFSSWTHGRNKESVS